MKDGDILKDIDGVKIVVEEDLDRQFEEVFVAYGRSFFGKRFFVTPSYGIKSC